MKVILPDHTVIKYNIVGEGMPLVLLHGNLQSSKIFKNQVEFFSKHYKVITVDSRGHGASTFGNEKLTISLLSKDIDYLIQKLIQEPYVLFGFSDGANIALKQAIENPTKIKAMVLISPNIDIDGIHKSFYKLIQMGYYLLQFIDFLSPVHKLRNILFLMLSNPDISAEELENIEFPVLLLSGTNDIIKKQHIELISNHIRTSELKWISNAPHMFLKTRSEELNQSVFEFIIKTTSMS